MHTSGWRNAGASPLAITGIKAGQTLWHLPHLVHFSLLMAIMDIRGGLLV
jgi:hypothetical protein